jgi:hypothetical protein
MRNKIYSIGPSEKVPESFVEKWGGEWGHPAKDGNGKVIGYVESMPSAQEKEIAEIQFEKAIETFVAL